MTVKELFGQRIKFLRQNANLTQSELADRANTELVTIARIEGGENWVSAPMLDAICNALAVDYIDLFDFKDSKTPTLGAKLKSIIIQLNNMNDRELDYFLNNVKAYNKLQKSSK